MKGLGRAFDCAKEFYYADWRLQYTAGSARWFPEFSQMNFLALRFMFDLLKRFHRYDICCHIGGSFPTYLIGLQTGFNKVKIFVALKKAPLINLIFQRGEILKETSYVGRFTFALY